MTTSDTPMMVTTNVKTSTSDKYARIFNSLLRRYHEDGHASKEGAIDWDNFARWSINYAESQSYSANYRRLVRASLLFSLASIQEETAPIGYKLTERWEPSDPDEEESEQEEFSAERRTRKSARMIPKEDWSNLINYFNTRRSILNMRAQVMLAAGVGCGARPIEWINAKLVADNVIRIYTAKIKNKNAWDKVKPSVFTESEFENPADILSIVEDVESIGNHFDQVLFEDRIQRSGLDPVQDADLVEQLRLNRKGADTRIFRDVVFDEEFKIPIEMNLRYIESFFCSKFGDDWRSMDQEILERVYVREYYNGVRIAIWRACKKLFGEDKLYSPADTRSTFSANRKAQAGLRQASSDLGHTSVNMTRAHYASARDAWSR